MNRKLIFIFPGQASQYVGMGRDLHDNSQAARDTMARICRMDGLEHIRKLCFEGPGDLLTRTDNVQPAITAVSLMALASLKEHFSDRPEPIQPLACAGHSLGEYTAHAAAGNLNEETAMKLVTWRGRWMNEASQPPNPAGAMVAVIGLGVSIIEPIVDQVGRDTVAIANLNSPGQVILSGEKTGIEQAADLANEAGAKRTVMLNVSGAWHSPLMNMAQVKMRRLLQEEITPEKIKINNSIGVVANATAEVVESVGELKNTLHRQITAPVQWEMCVRKLVEIADSPDIPSRMSDAEMDRHIPLPLFVEIGPGKVLKGLLRSIDRKLEVVNIDLWSDITDLEEKL